jgi:hypothetical protein
MRTLAGNEMVDTMGKVQCGQKYRDSGDDPQGAQWATPFSPIGEVGPEAVLVITACWSHRLNSADAPS